MEKQVLRGPVHSNNIALKITEKEFDTLLKPAASLLKNMLTENHVSSSSVVCTYSYNLQAEYAVFGISGHEKKESQTVTKILRDFTTDIKKYVDRLRGCESFEIPNIVDKPHLSIIRRYK